MSLNASVTVTPMLIDRHWTSDGTNFYRLCVSTHRNRRYIKTNIRVRKNELSPDGRLKSTEKRHSLEDLVRKTENIVSSIDCFALQSMNVDDVVTYIKNYSAEDFKLDFFSFADVIIGEKTGQSRKTYRTAVNSFKAFHGKDSMDIAELSSAKMRSWEKWLRDKHGDGARAISAYTACIAFIHGQARHRALDKKVIQKMITMRPSLTGREKLGVDAFLLSFALMGMNTPDLYIEQEGHAPLLPDQDQEPAGRPGGNVRQD